MKKLLLLFFIISMMTVNVYALGKLEVKLLVELAPTHKSMKILDADGKYAPALIVKTQLKGLGFKNIGRPTPHAAQYDVGLHQYKFYLNDKQRVIQITHADYEPLEVRLLADWDVEVKAQRVYEMVLEHMPEKELIPFSIITTPEKTTKYVDGKLLGTNESYELTLGEHELKVEKSGLKTLIKTINVSKEKPFVEMKLTNIETVVITIKSVPQGANISIDSKDEGKTDDQLFRYPRKYSLRLSKDKYEPVEDSITVTEAGKNVFEYVLLQNIFPVTFNVQPEGCEISINTEKLIGITKELPIGTHTIHINKSGYESVSETFAITQDGSKAFAYNLIKNTSLLTINTTPTDCKIYLFEKLISGHTMELSAGKHLIEVKKDGYYDEKRDVEIVKGVDKNEVFSLTAKTGTLQFKVQPIDAITDMIINGKSYNSWSGAKVLKEVPIGEYSLNSELDGYMSSSKTVLIKENKTTNIEVKLDKKIVSKANLEINEIKDSNSVVKRDYPPTPKFVVYEDPPQVISSVIPEYPEFAKRSGLQGDVWLDVEVLKDGSVGEIEVIESLQPGHYGLDESAVIAVKQWKFKPAVSNGKVVACWVKFPVRFVF
ncbi:MAG: TonB family protein [Candidatus Zophobacter franzmannii]|nr:TonB family protein [Candidatus Zophobacter franzmannii]